MPSYSLCTATAPEDMGHSPKSEVWEIFVSVSTTAWP